MFTQNGITKTSFDSNITVNLTKINGITATFTNRGDIFNKTNLQFLLYREVKFSFTENVLGLGFRQNNPANYGMFTFQELVIFENTDDATAKQNNINARYNIY